MGVELYVKAAPGLRVPREDAPRRYTPGSCAACTAASW